MKFTWSVKNIVIIACAAVLAVAAAVVGTVALVKVTKKTMGGDFESGSGYYSVSLKPPAVSSEPEVQVPIVEEKGLVITSPKKLNSTVTESAVLITGNSDIEHPLLMNGAEVQRSADGSFVIEVNLNIGKNKFAFEHKGKTTVCNINYRYVVINYYSPSSQQKYESGSTFVVSVTARKGSQVTATFSGKTITLMQEKTNENKEFLTFTGSFSLPDNNDIDLNMGKVKFVGSYNGITETFNSGKIICLKNHIISSSPYVAEIIAFNAETFSGSTTDDRSDPRNNYLPKGTVDYCDSGLVYDSSSKNNYIKLRCGRRVYLEKLTDDRKDKVAVTNRYRGTLPDHNEISVSSFKNNGRHTVLTLDCMWKAPFLLDINPQSYKNPSARDFTISSATYQYVDIKFCYATVFNGKIDIPASNPVFSSAEIIRGSNFYTLRLWLKKQGKFYGWDSYYNDNGQLCFEFLNPVNTKVASNNYGVDLTGAKIAIDPGHGGVQPGTCRGNTKESERNLYLAQKIKTELESIGATVVMVRNDDYEVTSDDRRLFLRQQKPDYCISLHHNAAGNKGASGFEAFHFNAFSSDAAKYVEEFTRSSGIYSSSKLKWHYFFLARATNCPVVLAENGYFTNNSDYNGIISDYTNTLKARAIVQGIAKYFLSIQYTPVLDPEPEPDPPVVIPPDTDGDTDDTESGDSSTAPEPPEGSDGDGSGSGDSSGAQGGGSNDSNPPATPPETDSSKEENGSNAEKGSEDG